MIVPITGILAFGIEMAVKNNKYYNNNFEKTQPSLVWIYYIVSFYMFLNIAAFPVLTITSRNNLMKAFVPNRMPAKTSDITWISVIFTLIVVVPIGGNFYSKQLF